MAIIKIASNNLHHIVPAYTRNLNKTLELIKDGFTLGLYVYLSSKPPSWTISETELMRRFGKGKNYIRDRLKELRELGLLKRFAIKNKKGLIVKWESVLYPEPQPIENKEKPTEETHMPANSVSGQETSVFELDKCQVNPRSSRYPVYQQMVPRSPRNKRKKKIKDNTTSPIVPFFKKGDGENLKNPVNNSTEDMGECAGIEQLQSWPLQACASAARGASTAPLGRDPSTALYEDMDGNVYWELPC